MSNFVGGLPNILNSSVAKRADVNVNDLSCGGFLRILADSSPNAQSGVLTLTGTTAVVVNTTAYSDGDRVFLTRVGDVGLGQGFIRVTGGVDQTSFSVVSSNVDDNATVNWFIVKNV